MAHLTRTHSETRRLVTGVVIAMVVLAGALLASPSPAAAATTEVSGWVLDSDGSVEHFGSAPDLGDSSGSGSAVGIVANRAATGYWVLWANGKVTTHGNVTHFGDLTGFALNRPAVSLSVLPSEDGYVVLAADGGVFTFGSAKFYGSVPGVSLEAARNTTAVSIHLASAGYRIVHDDGGVFAFGNAAFVGSVPGVLQGATLDQPIVDAISSTSGSAYAMVASDGGVFAFGLAFSGSLGGSGRKDITAAASDGIGGYAILDDDGTVHWFGTSQEAVVQVSTSDSTGLAITDVKLGTPASPPPTSPPPTSPPPTSPPPTSPPTSGAPPASGVVTIWPTHTEAAGPGDYFEPSFNDQGNWLSPNLTTGDAILRLNITDKPTSKPIEIQVCGWYWLNGTNFNGGFKETCSSRTEFSNETNGTVSINLGAPKDWWKKNNEFPWDKGPDIMRIIVKDLATQSLMMATRCGSACYTGSGSVHTHVPITMTASLTFNN